MHLVSLSPVLQSHTVSSYSQTFQKLVFVIFLVIVSDLGSCLLSLSYPSEFLMHGYETHSLAPCPIYVMHNNKNLNNSYNFKNLALLDS